MVNAKERKNNKVNYVSLIGDLEERGLMVNYRTLEIGSLGHYLADAVGCISGEHFWIDETRIQTNPIETL